MADERVTVDRLADAIMEGLQEDADLASDEMKKAVKKSSTTVKNEISADAPTRSGRYARSWRTKTT